MTLLDSLVFDSCNGTLITSSGIIPNYSRNSPGYGEYNVNGSLKLVGAAYDEPRFSVNGAVYLEKASTNFVTHSTQFAHSSWVKGSSWSVLSDRVPGLAGTYVADRISIAATLGNQDAQTMYKELTFGSGETYTATTYIKLAGGRFGPNDKIEVINNVAAPQVIPLGVALNENPGNWIALPLTFITAGTPPANYETDDTPRTIRFRIYVENAVSFDLGGVQIEPGTIRTSFIESEAEGSKVASRDGDRVLYPANPVEGLQSFAFYVNLETWRGDGLVFKAGNFVVDIFDGKARAAAGAVTIIDTDNLPESAKIAVRVSRGLERLKLYVGGVLKAEQSLTGYVATAGNPTIAGEGVRRIKPLYLFNRDIGDGSVAIGQRALADMLTLHTQDSLFPELSEGYGVVQFPPIKILPGDSARVRLPQIRFANQTLSTVTPGGGAVAQVERVTVRTIVNAAAVQRDAIMLNKTTFEFTSDATPTATEIGAGLAAMINSTPKLEAVTASAAAGVITLTADIAGDPFYLTVSENLSQVNVTASVTSVYTVTVPAAVDFEVGRASVYRGYSWICDVVIETINTTTNALTLSVSRNSDFALFLPGDALVQPLWQSNFGRTTYFISHLEDHSDIRISEKTEEFFTFKNLGVVDRLVTPRLRVTL